MERMEIALEEASGNGAAGRQYRHADTSEADAHASASELAMAASILGDQGRFSVYMQYRRAIRHARKRMRAMDAAGVEWSPLYDRRRAQFIALARVRDANFDRATGAGDRVRIAPSMYEELENYKKNMWEKGLENPDDTNLEERTALSESDRQDARLVSCRKHYSALLQTNKYNMDKHERDTKVSQQLRAHAMEERSALYQELEFNLEQIRQTREPLAEHGDNSAGVKEPEAAADVSAESPTKQNNMDTGH
jgi:hypothetical protein